MEKQRLSSGDRYKCLYKTPIKRCVKSGGKSYDELYKSLSKAERSALRKMCNGNERGGCVVKQEYKSPKAKSTKPKGEVPLYTAQLGAVTNEIREYVQTKGLNRVNFKSWLKRRGYPLHTQAGYEKFEELYEKLDQEYGVSKAEKKPKSKIPLYTAPLGALTKEIKKYLHASGLKEANFKNWLKRHGYPVQTEPEKYNMLYQKAERYLSDSGLGGHEYHTRFKADAQQFEELPYMA